MLTKILKTGCKIFILSISDVALKKFEDYFGLVVQWIMPGPIRDCQRSGGKSLRSGNVACCFWSHHSDTSLCICFVFSLDFCWMNQVWPYLGLSKIKGRIYQRWKNCQTLHQSICFSTTSQLLLKIADHTNPKENLKCKALSHNTWSCPYVKWLVDDIEIAHCNVSQLSKFWWALIWEYNYEVNSCWALCTKAENKWCKYSFKDGWSNLHLVL